MRSYNGRGVLAHWCARPMDPKKICPDVMCDLVVTDQFALYVLEDNYDGSFLEHFTWPFERIIDIDIAHGMAKGAGHQTEEPLGRAGEVAAAVMGALSGVSFISGGRKQAKAPQYLRVRYWGENGRENQFYFEDFEGNPQKAAKFWRKNGSITFFVGFEIGR